MGLKDTLAINGGPKAIETDLPSRGNFGIEEKNAIIELFDKHIKMGTPPGYNGEQEKALCDEFTEYMGGGYADGVNSGTNSVFVAVRALDLEPFTEIIVSCVTDPGGIMPILMNNCIPVVADAEPGKYNVGVKQIEELISPLTSAILVSHIGGEPADIENIVKLAKKHNLYVVEDVSQSHGATLNGKKLGTFGDIAAFSTMFGKHFSTGGQGGIVYTKNEELYNSEKRCADRGKPFNMPGHTNVIASLNFNMDETGATVGRVQFKKLPSIVERRRQVAEKLKVAFKKELKAIIVPEQIKGAESSYWFWRLEVDVDKISCAKDEFCDALSAEGIGLNKRYDAALPHTMEWFKNKKAFGSKGFPWTAPQYKGDANREFPIPNAYASLDRQFNFTLKESFTDTDIEAIVKAFKKVEQAYIK